MNTSEGANIKGLKNKNRALVLKVVATESPISRVEIARRTGLAKMTVSNLVNELIKTNFITETVATDEKAESSLGRKPSMLCISPSSPCICGMLIKRGLCRVILADISGHILCSVSKTYDQPVSAEWLIQTLTDSFFRLKERTERSILAIGVSSIGPLNTHLGRILDPPFFYGIQDLPVTELITARTGLPVFLINDANAGALAEKLYGLGRLHSSFIYLHIMNGIGAGFILNDKLYNGHNGRSGEIGHTSINFSGPKCVCGNVGCLELYANLDQMQKKIRVMAAYWPDSPLAGRNNVTWEQILEEAARKDFPAVAALEEFCGYISYALLDVMKLLDLSTIIVGYDSSEDTHIIESLLYSKLSEVLHGNAGSSLKILHSHFNGDAPLIGAIAAVTSQIFSTDFPILENEA